MVAKFSARSNGARISGQWLIIGGLFLSLIVVSALLAQPRFERTYDVTSAGPGGLLALNLWLEDLGYQVSEMGSARYELTDRYGQPADLLFVYPNIQFYTEVEANQLARWLEAGGTLVLVGPHKDDVALIDHFGAGSTSQTPFGIAPELAQQPLIPSPPEGWSMAVNSAELDISQAPNAVPILAVENDTLSVSDRRKKTATAAIQQIGDGFIWHLSPSHDLTNQGLEIDDDAYILPALLRTVPDGGTVLFDTYHLYGSSGTTAGDVPRSMQDWLYQTYPGRAIIFGAILIFGFLLLQGIRLGPPLPLRETMIRREAAEYVVAMAGLRRRLGEPTQVAEYQRRHLKQILGKPLNIPVTLPDDEFIRQWQEHDQSVSQETINEVTEILVRLSLKLNERMLVETAARIDKLKS